MAITIGSVSEIVGNTSLRHACCWLRGLGVQSPQPSQSSGLEVCGTRAAMVGRWIKVMIKNDGWAVTPFWVMECKAEPITTGLPSERITECINYEYLQSICKNKYFITCTKVVYISLSVFVKNVLILDSFFPCCRWGWGLWYWDGGYRIRRGPYPTPLDTRHEGSTDKGVGGVYALSPPVLCRDHS